MLNSDLQINLSEHKNPAEFMQELNKKYPDDNVELDLRGTVLYVNIKPVTHLQEKINILSFLNDRAKEAIHGL